jgi:pyruvate,water dikinase
MVGHLDGRIYYRLDSLYHMHSHIRCFRPLWSTWEQAIGLARAGDRSPARRRGSRLAAGCRVAELLLRAVVHRHQTRRFFRWWGEAHQGFQDVSALCPHDVVEAYHALWAQVARRWGVTLANNVFLLAVTWAITGLLRRWVPEADRSMLNGMLCGGPENRSAAALRSAIRLAETAAASPALRAELIADSDPRERWMRLTASGSPFGDALCAHMRSYGDRGLHDLKLEARTPRQQPWMVLHTLRAYLEQGQSVRVSEGTEIRIRRQAERELRQRCRNPVKRVCLSTLFAAMRALMRIREDARFCRSELIGDCRELLLRLGAELAATGRIAQDRDVLDLTVDEVLGAFEGTLPGADLRALVTVRARERARWSDSEPLPTSLETDPDDPLAVALRRTQAAGTAPPYDAATVNSVLTGLASSSGTVRGLAKVVFDPSTDATQCRDRILVARETDPGWMFLMLSAKALVVERGTLLSHTAITGRVLGIPTVVAVDNATALIADGSLIEVDGSAGTVRILDGAQ